MPDAVPAVRGRRRFTRFLYVGAGAALLTGILLLNVAGRGLERIGPLLERLLGEFGVLARETNNMDHAILSMLADTRGYIRTRREKYQHNFNDDRRVFREAVGKIRRFMDEPREQALFTAVVRGEVAVRSLLVRQMAMRRRGMPAEQVVAMATPRDLEARLSLRADLSSLSGLAEQELVEQIANVYKAQARVSRRLGVIALGGISLALVFSLWWGRRIAALYEAVDRLSRLKGEFLAIASHDLRTPLTTIHGVSQMLVAGHLGALSDHGRRLAEMLRDESDRMRRLIESYLDLTRLEEGVFTLQRAALDLDALVRGHLERVRPQFELRNVALACDSDGAAPILGDADRLSEVLDNLLTNALKFSKAGDEVRIGISSGRDGVRVAISDQGPGLEPHELERIFDRLSRGEAGRRTTGGLGLGLAVAREIVTRHGGRIWAESDGAGRGALFIMELPAGDAPARDG